MLCEWIDDVAEVAGSRLFCCRGHGGKGHGVVSINPPESLVVHEEERPVAEDGSGKTATILILAELRFAAEDGGRGEEVASVSDVVAKELVDGTVKLVRAGLGDDVDGGATGAADFGCVKVDVGAYFCDGFHRGTQEWRSVDAAVVVESIHKIVVEDFLLAVGRYRISQPAVALAGSGQERNRTRGACIHARLHLNETDVVATIQGCVDERLLGDRTADGGAVCLERGGRCGHFDGVSDTARLQTRINANAIRGREHDVGGDEILEGRCVHAEGIASRLKRAKDEFSIPPGGECPHLVGTYVFNADRCARDGGARAVGNVAEDVSRGDLRQHWRGAGKCGEADGIPDGGCHLVITKERSRCEENVGTYRA